MAAEKGLKYVANFTSESYNRWQRSVWGLLGAWAEDPTKMGKFALRIVKPVMLYVMFLWLRHCKNYSD